MSDLRASHRDAPAGGERDYVEEWADERDAASRARAERRRARRERRPRRRKRVRAARGRNASAHLWSTRWGRGLIVAVGALALATLVGLLALWPHGQAHVGNRDLLGGATLAAKVATARDVRCPGPAAQRCRQIVVRIGQGPDRGTSQTITLGPAAVAPTVHAGDSVRVQRAAGAPAANVERYGFVSVDRRGTMLWLAIAFALLVILLARRRGVLALIGFALSLWLVTHFAVPAVADGGSAFAVALVGSFAVMLITVVLTYGLSASSLAAILGIAASLLLAALLGVIAVQAARLDGRASEVSQALTQLDASVSLQGVVLAGLVFGALGVLADQAVTQASAVLALRRASPQLSVRGLYREALTVGRDHLIATTHTLVLVYVGATFPLLLVLQVGHVGAIDALNTQDLAEPVIATLVGAIALLVSVPLTTALAALVAAPAPPDALPASDGHAHHHH
jgi:uncharacterized membrane protein